MMSITSLKNNRSKICPFKKYSYPLNERGCINNVNAIKTRVFIIFDREDLKTQ